MVLLSKLYVFEKITVIYSVIAILLMGIYGVPISFMGGYIYYQFFLAVAVAYILIIIYICYVLFKQMIFMKNSDLTVAEKIRIIIKNSLVFSKATYFNWRFYIYFLRASICILVTLMFFANLKQIIPIVNPRLYDLQMWRIDKVVHFGVSPVVFLVDILRINRIIYFLDLIYITFIPMNIIIPVIFIIQTKSEIIRKQFLAVFCISWVVGGISYFLFPAMGPCYFKPEFFQFLDMPIAKNLQQILLEEYVKFRQSAGQHIASNYYGIAAMPSLHLAKTFIFMLFSRRLNRYLFIFFCVYLVLMFIGSVALGWHYAIDGYIGIAMAYIIYIIIVRLIKH